MQDRPQQAELIDDSSDRILPSLDPASPMAIAARVKLAELRQRLLDLSNRNRLINFKHTNRGGRRIRIVAESLPKMCSILEGERSVEFLPLPELPSTPDDEQKSEFIAALNEALLTDDTYQKVVEKNENEPDEKAEALLAKAQRALRDRLRTKLGWPTRSEVLSLSISEHARRFGIDPSYDLIKPPSRGRRRVNQWQTLLNEIELERRLRALEHQARESREEYGIETLYLIAGFLEWRGKKVDGDSELPNLSPLLLVPLGIRKQKPERLSRTVDDKLLLEEGGEALDQHREIYTIFGGTDEPTLNLCLRERLRQDEGIELPEWNSEGGVELFLHDVEKAISSRTDWKVKTYATISHLTFNRLAMWEDLDPANEAVSPPHVHPVLGELFGGGVEHGDTTSDEETHDSEAGVPSLILDCDSSQFAAIKSALAGRNLTIQGPPGTGKSQTIANLIASFLHEGKTVLFVAEKMAALEVVNSRLADAGMSDFLLELHSAKASKKSVLESLRRRINRRKKRSDGISSTIKRRRANLRDKLDAYASAINSPFGQTGLTVHDIIWRFYEYRDKPLPDELTGYYFSEVSWWDADAIEHRIDALETYIEIETRYKLEGDTYGHPWWWVLSSKLHVEQCSSIHHYVVDLHGKLQDLRQWLDEVKIVTLPTSFMALRILAKEVLGIGKRPLETALGQWQLALKQDGVSDARRVAAAHDESKKSAEALNAIAPGLLKTPFTNKVFLEEFYDLITKVVPQVKATTDIEKLKAQSEENVRVMDQLGSAMDLMARLGSIFTWKVDVSEEELCAANTFIELAAITPSALVGKRHNLGRDGQNALVLQKLDEMDACQARCNKLDERLKIHVAAQDHATLVAHRDQLSQGGLFAYFKTSYRAAISYCKNVFPDIPKTERLSFISELCDVSLARQRVGADETLVASCGDLFSGWETSRPELRGCCEWVNLVRQKTPILEKYSQVIRETLFSISDDQVELAGLLSKEGWPKLLKSLANQCRRQDVALAGLRESIVSEQNLLSRAMDALHTLEWEGTLSHDRVNQVIELYQSYTDTRKVLNDESEVVELLMPAPEEALAAINAINAAQLRIQNLPIQTSWRQRLLTGDSSSNWADVMGHVANLEARLDEIEAVDRRLHILAASQSTTAEQWHRTSLSEWSNVLQLAAANERLLTTRANYLATKSQIDALGLSQFVRGARGPAMEKFTGVRDLFSAVYLRSCAFQAFNKYDALAEFKTGSPATIREKFSQLDQELKLLHKQELIELLSARTPPSGIDVGLVKERTEMGLLRHVVNLERPRTTVRDLIRRAGRAIQTLKPCFMMSPLSVAQLIKRGCLVFDVVIFDEASQIRPEDAMCAIVRSRQFVVVGDQMQLPPTTFGEKSFADELIENEEGNEVEESAAVESILQLATTTYGSGRMLLWHYRSRDPSLIAFSNREFYRNELLLFPCPTAKSQETGVKYVWVGGRYSARTNPDEAKACAQAAIEFMRHSPMKSLGIVALNRPQADLIQLELDRLIHENEYALRYQSTWSEGLEPLFVKNLENVQGDERDTIFVSTVFGEDQEGNFYQRFGPINSPVGHRRLNVLFTRAKDQLVLFSSLPTEKIIPSESTQWGVRALKQYLDFARTGQIESGVVTGKSEDSPFEVAVRHALEAAGYQCEPQVGISGFFVDLGVRHPRFPDHFLAGIECDGAAYHSSRSARDRDRLRQAILENLGWKIYRIWSTDWFSDPHGQLQKLKRYLEDLKSASFGAAKRECFDFATRFGKTRPMADDEHESNSSGTGDMPSVSAD